jgi:hypothetical protein
MSKGKGYYRGDKLAHEHEHFKAIHHLVGAQPAAVTYPIDLLPFAPPRMDQSDTSSCYAHFTSAAIYIALACAAAKAGEPPPAFVPSQKGIYDDGREEENGPGPDGGRAPLEDSGADPVAAAPALGKRGVRALKNPIGDRNSDCDPATINQPETLANDEESAAFIIDGEYAIDPTSADYLDKVDAALAMDLPVGIGIPAEGPFEDAGDVPVTADTPALDAPVDRTKADHWVGFVGVRKNPVTGKREYRVLNSWSKNWGDDGTEWVSETWAANAVEQSIVFAVRKRPDPAPPPAAA